MCPQAKNRLTPAPASYDSDGIPENRGPRVTLSLDPFRCVGPLSPAFDEKIKINK